MNLSNIFSEKMGTLIGLLSLIVAVTVGILQFRPKSRELTCNVTSSTELTAVSQVPGLTSEFTYQQKKVIHMWKVTMTLINSGTDTIVGEGKQSTLLNDQMLFSFPENTEILNLELTNSDLPIQTELTPPNVFALKFPQWRSGEKANLSVYITSQSGQPSPLLPQPVSRDIVDGNVLVTYAVNSASPPKTSMERLPSWLSILVRVILSTACATVVYLAFYLFPKEGLLPYLRLKVWKRRYWGKFKEFVAKHPSLDEKQRESVLAEPTILTEEGWKGFEGKKLKIKSDAESAFSSSLEALGITTLILILGTSSLIYFSSNAYDLYLKVRSYF